MSQKRSKKKDSYRWGIGFNFDGDLGMPALIRIRDRSPTNTVRHGPK